MCVNLIVSIFCWDAGKRKTRIYTSGSALKLLKCAVRKEPLGLIVLVRELLIHEDISAGLVFDGAAVFFQPVSGDRRSPATEGECATATGHAAGTGSAAATTVTRETSA